METSHLIYSAKQMTGFHMKCNASLNWVNVKYFLMHQKHCEKKWGNFPHVKKLYSRLLSPSCPDSGVKEKINLKFYFHSSLWYPKGFLKAVNSFIKPFEVDRKG